MNVGNLISGSTAFSKPSMYIWKFLIQVLLKPNLKDFEHNLTSMGSEHNCLEIWTFFSTALLWSWDENLLFQSCGHCWISQICWHIECSTLTASSFRILNSSAGIPSPPLALLVVMLPKAHLTLHSRMSGCRRRVNAKGSLWPFCTVLLCILFFRFFSPDRSSQSIE